MSSLKKIHDFSVREIIEELNSRGMITNSESNSKVLSKLSENENLNLSIILSLGYPDKNLECRECYNILESKEFSFYLSRVDKNGFLMRSNALCHSCASKSNKERQKVFESTNLPPKPKKGDICSHCNRKWNGNWHRHHEGDKFIEWLCGHCNMSFSDQRNNTSV